MRWIDSPWEASHPDRLRLDRELPSLHRVRLIDRVVDSLDLQPHLLDFCKGFGSPAWPLPLLLKLALYELDRKVLSPSQWFRDCREHTPLQWLLAGAHPSRSSLYDFRRRLSAGLLERLNRQVLLAARAEGHCPARRGSLDGTFIAAKASRHHLLNLRRLEKRLALLEQAIAEDEAIAIDLGGAPSGKRPRWLARSPQGRRQQRRRYLKAQERLRDKRTRHQQRQSHRAKANRRPLEQVVIAVSEPEAVVGRDKTKVTRPLYNVQMLRDVDSPFVLGYGTFAQVTDGGLLPEMLTRTQALCGALPEDLLADKIYASVEDLKACRNEGVTLWAPVKEPAARKPTPPEAVNPPPPAEAVNPPPPAKAVNPPPPEVPRGKRQELPMVPAAGKAAEPSLYGKERFVWDEQTRGYTCPAGERLERRSRSRDRRVHGPGVEMEVYGTRRCEGCVQREKCTRSRYGRRIKRMVDEPMVEELRKRMASPEGKELYKRRKETIEREFAEVKEHRGMRQFSGYGQRQAETQVGLVVLLGNGKALQQRRQAAQSRAA